MLTTRQLLLRNAVILNKVTHATNSSLFPCVGTTFQTQLRGKKSRSKGPRKPPKNKPHKVLLEKVNFAKHEMEKTEGPRKNSWEYKANKRGVAYAFTPNDKANKRILAEKNKELNPPGVKKEHQMKGRNKELAAQIFAAANNKDPKTAIEAYHRFTAKPDVRVYTALIKACASQKGFIGEAVQIYNDLKKQNVTPSMVTFERLMDVCIQDEHMARGFFFLKEMLRHLKSSKPKETHLPVFFKLIRLCRTVNNPSKAVSVYQVMLAKQYFTLPQFAESKENFQKNSIPLIFVQSALNSKEDDAKEFWIKMNEKVQFNFRERLEPKQEEATYEYLALNDFSEALRQSENIYQNIYEDTRYVSAMDAITLTGQSFAAQLEQEFAGVNNAEEVFALPTELRNIMHPKLSLKTTYHLQEPRIDEMLQHSWENMLNKAGDVFDEYVLSNNDHSDEFWDGFSPIQIAAIKDPEQLGKLMQIAQQHSTIETPEEQKAFAEQTDIYFKKLQLKHANKINWIPVIIGIDNEPFYPQNIGMHELTEETVQQAKQQYLDSIADADAREQIAANMYDQILLRFVDPKTKSLIEGLYY